MWLARKAIDLQREPRLAIHELRQHDPAIVSRQDGNTLDCR